MSPTKRPTLTYRENSDPREARATLNVCEFGGRLHLVSEVHAGLKDFGPRPL